MTIDELIDRLTEYRDAHSGDTEVRLMTQANYPFEYNIAGVVANVEMEDEDGESIYEDPELDENGDLESPPDPVVYLVEGDQLGYGTKAAWNNL